MPGAGPEPQRNKRGVIAEHYYALQSLGAIEAARNAMLATPATREALLVALYQSAEIALYNLADLLTRASNHLGHKDIDSCVTNLQWVRSFHRVLVRLGHDALRVSDDWEGEAPRWPIDTTPGFEEFAQSLRSFDQALLQLVEDGELDVEATIAGSSLERAEYNVLHCARIANHDARAWSASLARAARPGPPGVEVSALLASDHLRYAVHEHHLTGDTYFTQFRALHQIPELLVREINDRLEIATRFLNEGDVEAALDVVEAGAVLYGVIEACLPPIVDNLSTHDYHQIRENLGLTSGSHSVSMRFHLFTDLYQQFVEAISRLQEATSDHPLLPRLRRQVTDLRVFIFAWRDMHLHLPRNNLGGLETKSLTGAQDAVRTVRKMRDNAASADPLALASRGKSLMGLGGPLDSYLDGPDSSDAMLLAATGRITQATFPDVQERRDFFSQRTPFTRPPRRDV